MLKFGKLDVSRFSAGTTAFVAAGLLVNAILTDNGGSPSSQAEWREAANQSSALSVGSRGQGAGDVESVWIDPFNTGSLKKSDQSKLNARMQIPEPTVLSIIRNNSEIAPAVSSGTARVSVTVKPGDTLFAIGKRHGLRVDEIARLNGLEAPFTIKVGQTLYIAR